ncbi:cation efflux family-domain-containing protein [Cristinia sonorae]|uniref:Cation efflux family-domain-containing protein n=1 Tax=Cristinia sonorae TaxID=1940300 RepID=A0A8K0UJW0_9AGAR|nr:cation efflux family-domain-containing protein [Cristinia sonorae]
MDSRRRTKLPVGDAGSLMFSHLVPELLSNVLFVTLAHLGALRSLLSPAEINSLLAKATIGTSIACSLWLGASGQWRRASSMDWSWIGFASLVFYLKSTLLLFVLSRVNSIRVVLLLRYAPAIADSVLRAASKPRALLISCGLLVPFVIDLLFSYRDAAMVWIVYTSLAANIALNSAYDHATTNATATSAVGRTVPVVTSVIGAAILAILATIPGIVLPPSSMPPSVSPDGFPHYLSTALLILSASLYHPRISKKIGGAIALDRLVSYVVTSGWLLLVCCVWRGSLPTVPDAITVICILTAIQRGNTNSRDQSSTAFVRTARSYLDSILANPESRKIFYFLMLNMCYMLVQMLYGIWTNSLGLISDAIHMAFDCMAIGVGLVASVMARWPPNERYTYGYSRIETLSGFSNGIFLILISVFIVFEAVQRILSPPEMNTSQLLLVSSGGLAVNLFGMFAMGGHHHHGHSHSHRHDHSHGSQHQHDDTHSHSSSHQHGDHHGHDHGHSHHNTHSTSHEVKDLPEPKALRATQKFELDNAEIPLTPSYRFEHDDHLEHFHGQQPHSTHQSHEGHSHNMRGVFLHVMADTLGSVGVIISTLLIQFYGWTGFDPIASLFIAILIAASVVPLIADTGKVLLLDITGEEHGLRRAVDEIEHMQGVTLHSSIVWPKNDSGTVGSVHIQLGESGGPRLYQILDQIEHCLKDNVKSVEELTVSVMAQ